MRVHRLANVAVLVGLALLAGCGSAPQGEATVKLPAAPAAPSKGAESSAIKTSSADTRKPDAPNAPAVLTPADKEKFDDMLRQAEALEADVEFLQAQKVCREIQEAYREFPDLLQPVDAMAKRLRDARRVETDLAAQIKNLTKPGQYDAAFDKLAEAGPVARIMLRHAVLKDADTSVVIEAIRALISMRDDGAPKTFLARLKTKSPDAIRNALVDGLRALADIMPADMLPDIYKTFKSDPPQFRDYGALSVAGVRRHSNGSREKYAELLKDPDAFELLKKHNLIAEIPQQGLVLWLKFDETAGAAAGNSAGLQVPGGTLNGATWTKGRFDGGVACNGVDQFVQVDAKEFLPGKDNEDFSVAFWIYYETGAAGAWRNFTHKGNADSERCFAIWCNPDADRLHFRISTDVNGNEGGDSVGLLQPGNWYHIAYVKKEKNLTLFLNGAQDSSVDLAGNTVGNNGPIYIGKDPWYPGVEGKYDDYVIYNRALTPEEVKSMAGAVEKVSNAQFGRPETAPQF